MKKIGFTGTREGMTVRQGHSFVSTLLEFTKGGEFEFHHGDCIGADDDAQFLIEYDGRLAKSVFRIVIHPGHSAFDATNDSKRANNRADEIRESKTHFARNRDIVQETDLLIVCSVSNPIPRTGGTRYTYDYAKKLKKNIIVIYPNGEVVFETYKENDEKP